MDFKIINFNEVCDCLIKDKSIHSGEDIQLCCSIGDIIFAIEQLRKKRPEVGFSMELRHGTLNFFKSLRDGEILLASLDTNSLLDGMFIVDEYQNVEIWDILENSDIRPDHTIRLITYKYIDKLWGTNLLDQTIHYSGD